MTDIPYEQIRQLDAPAGPLTARQVEDFAQCPCKYLLAAFATRQQTREFLGGPAALGQAVRAAMMMLYGAGGPAQVALEHVLRTFEEHWQGSECKDSREEEDLHRHGLRMLEAHYESPLALSARAQTELRFEGEIGGHRFVATADIVEPGAHTVIRFTTSRRPPSGAQAAEDLSWGLLLLLASEALGGEVAGQIVVLRTGERIEVTPDDQARRTVAERLISAARRIRRETRFEPVTGKHCRWCRSRRDCPAWRK